MPLESTFFPAFSPLQTRVGEFGRRVTAFENPPEKLVQRKILDFDKVEERWLGSREYGDSLLPCGGVTIDGLLLDSERPGQRSEVQRTFVKIDRE